MRVGAGEVRWNGAGRIGRLTNSLSRGVPSVVSRSAGVEEVSVAKWEGETWVRLGETSVEVMIIIVKTKSMPKGR